MRDFMGMMTAPGKAEMLQREVLPLQPNQIRIEVKYCSICGSDLHIFNGKHPYAKLPVALGHEISGVIQEIGSAVTKFVIGQRVVVEPIYRCGVCDACRKGKYGFCKELSFQYRKGNGAMRKYFTIEEDLVFPIPDELSFSSASLIEPLAVAVHAVRRADIRIGEKVAVIGCGAIGLLVAAIAHQAGASCIISADIIDSKLQIAKEMGATHVVNTKNQSLKEKIIEITGEGVDKSIECVGLELTFNQALECLNMGGTATVLGIFEQSAITFTAPLIVARELTIRGCQAYCWDFPTAIEMASRINLSRIMTHCFPMSRLQEAMNVAADRTSGSIKVSCYPDWEE